MTHNMNLRPRPFSMIADGTKTIELRLLDEKRKRIAVGDTLVFANTAARGATLRCTVKNLYVFKSFAELYRELPLNKCGYLPEELASARAEDMTAYYSEEEQQRFGVVGIELELMAD